MYVKRLVEGKIISAWKEYPAVIIAGPRRAGKTTLVKKIAEDTGATYVSMDEPDALLLFNKDIKEFSERYLGETAVIDEVQYGKDVGRKIKYLVDIEKKRLLLTGSSARAISTNVLSFLVGRAYWLTLFPFNLKEIAAAKIGKNVSTPEWERLTRTTLETGCYPEVVLSDPKMRKERIATIVRATVSKETTELANSDETTVWATMKAISATRGGPVAISTLSELVGESQSRIKRVLNAMEESFLILRVAPYTRNLAKSMRRQKKIYFVDPGVDAYMRRFADPDGVSMETLVLSELLKKGYRPYFWRTKGGAEVDFVVETEEGLVGIEVKLRAKRAVPRSVRSFVSKENPSAVYIVDGLGGSWEERVGRTTVEKIPVWELWARLPEVLGPYP